MNFRYLLLISLGYVFHLRVATSQAYHDKKVFCSMLCVRYVDICFESRLVDGDCKLLWHCSRRRFPFLPVQSHTIFHCFRELSKV